MDEARVSKDADELDRRVGDAETVRERFEALGIAVVSFSGPDHRVVAVNAAYREFIGPQDYVGRPVRDLFPEFGGQMLLDVADRVYATGEAYSAKEWRIALDQSRTGQPEEIFIDTVVEPYRDVDGVVVGTTGYVFDVTERVRERQAAEQRATEAQQRYQAARDVVTELQQALLPAGLPVLPEATVSARYLVAAHDQAAGGDWFDALTLPDGRLGLIVGDIVGHGVAASAAMGQLCAVLSRALRETGDPAQALGWADRMAAESPMMRASTVCLAVLDPHSGAVRYATCGHPPPLVSTAHGATRYLPLTGGGPLGTAAPIRVAGAVLHPGEVLLLYSDGLVERSGQPMSQGLATLAQVAGGAVANQALTLAGSVALAERTCQQVMEIMTRGGYDDDVTVLAAERRTHPVEPLHCELSGDQAATPFADLWEGWQQWVAQFDLTARNRNALDLAVTELIANALEHAYPADRPGPVRLHAELGADGVLRVVIADEGTWREPTEPEPTSGRGLWMVGAVVDDLQVDHDGPHPGTRATIRHRLRHPVTLASEPSGSSNTTARSAPRAYFADFDEGPPRILRVTGTVDTTTADEFADRLATASRGGVHALVVDLTDVAVLSSAGISVLFTARDHHDSLDTPMTIVTAPDSIPADVLDLVGLHYTSVLPPTDPPARP